jgi:hypothetical protein
MRSSRAEKQPKILITSNLLRTGESFPGLRIITHSQVLIPPHLPQARAVLRTFLSPALSFSEASRYSATKSANLSESAFRTFFRMAWKYGAGDFFTFWGRVPDFWRRIASGPRAPFQSGLARLRPRTRLIVRALRSESDSPRERDPSSRVRE